MLAWEQLCWEEAARPTTPCHELGTHKLIYLKLYTWELNLSMPFNFKLSSQRTLFGLKSNFKVCTLKTPAWILNSKCVETRNLTFMSITAMNFPLYTKQIQKHARNRPGANILLEKSSCGDLTIYNQHSTAGHKLTCSFSSSSGCGGGLERAEISALNKNIG